MARKNEIAWRKGAAFSVPNEKPFGWWELVAVHLVAIAVTGVMWVVVDLVPGSSLRNNLRDIRAVHFGSLYLVGRSRRLQVRG